MYLRRLFGDDRRDDGGPPDPGGSGDGPPRDDLSASVRDGSGPVDADTGGCGTTRERGVSALATDAAHLTLAAWEMGQRKTFLVPGSVTATAQTARTRELTVTVQHESVAACALTEMGHRGTLVVQLQTETTASLE